MSISARYLSLAYDSAAATKGVARKTTFMSVRLIKDTDKVNPGKDSYITNVLLCGNCIDTEKRKLYVFYIDTYFGAAWIIEIGIDDRVQAVVYYDRDNDIGFDPEHKIYNARVVDGRIIWTDNKNPIYQIDVARAKNSRYYGIGYGYWPTEEWVPNRYYYATQIVSKGKYFYKAAIPNVGQAPDATENYWDRLCLLEEAYYSMNIENFYFAPIPPNTPPLVDYVTDDSRKINNLKQTLFQFAYRWIYMDWRKSTFSPASIVPLPQAEEETSTGLANEMISINNSLRVMVDLGGEEVRAVEIIARSSENPSAWFYVETIQKFSDQEREGQISSGTTIAVQYITLSAPEPTVEIINGPAAPVALAGTNRAHTNFRANWNASSGATGYLIDVATDSAFANILPAYDNLDVGNTLNFVISGLIPAYTATFYYYRLRAYNAGGTSGNSNHILTSTQQLPPVAPVAIAAFSVNSTFFSADWLVSVSPLAIGYRFDVATDAAFTNILPRYNNYSAGSATDWLITGLLVNTTYYYRVRSFDSAGQLSGNSNTITVTTLDVPGTPTALPATAHTSSGFTMNWTTVPNATGYIIQVSQDPLFGSFLPGWNYKYSLNYANSIAISGLSPSNTYYYRVRAWGSTGVGTNSNVITAVTLPSFPDVPIATAASSITATSFRANWNAADRATGYYLDVATDELFSEYLPGYQNRDIGNVLFFDISSLLSSTTDTYYYYRVRAHNAGGTSISSDVIETFTPGQYTSPPNEPECYAATQFDQWACVNVGWSARATATFYEVWRSIDGGPFVFIDAAGMTNYDDCESQNRIYRPATFCYKIKACNATGCSSFSNEVCVEVNTA